MLQSIRFVLESRASTFGLADLNSIFCAFETSFCLQKRLSKSYTWPAHSLLLHVSEQSFFFSELSYYIYTVAYCRQKSGMEFLARWVESPWLKDISWSYYILKYYIKKNNKNSKNMLNILNKIYMHINLYSYIMCIKSSIITQDCKKRPELLVPCKFQDNECIFRFNSCICHIISEQIHHLVRHTVEVM